MGRQEPDESGAGNEQLRARFNNVLDAYDDQRAALATARQQLAELRAQAVSSDRGVRVTVDSSGAVVEIGLEPAALRTTAESLAATLTAVAQAAAQQATLKCAAILAPLRAATDTMTEFTELIPGGPNLRTDLTDPAAAQ